MTSSYENIYSKFLGLITDHKLLALPKNKAYELMGETLSLVKGRPKINRLFSSLIFDDEIMTLSYELRDKLSDTNDSSFVEDIFANAMVVVWYEKLVNSDTNSKQYFGDKEVKFYSQSAHATAVKELLLQARKFLDRDYIRDHGWNSWVTNNL